MRSCLPRAGVRANGSTNFGLAYDVLGVPPSVPDDKRQKWLRDCANIATPCDYRHQYQRWKGSFGPGAKLCEVTMASRLLVGHGNASASEMGLTVNRTWGTPVIPGTALKGLVSGYVDAVYGPDPDAPASDDKNRDDWAASTWKGNGVVKQPGCWHARIFGSPAVGPNYQRGLRGGVAFHDALYVPEQVTCKPYEVDVLTVHQKQSYYDSHGGNWPNDWNDPVPIGFLTVKPGARFLLALEGPPEALKLTMELLLQALAEWGAGGKTSLGYGRIDAARTAHIQTGTTARGAQWVEATLATLMARERNSERTVLRGRGLANEWQKIGDPALKQEALAEIVSRWKKIGLWENTTGKAALQAKAIYEST